MLAVIGEVCTKCGEKNEKGDLEDTVDRPKTALKTISEEYYKKLEKLGLLEDTVGRDINIGKSNYATKTIQPYSIWLDYPELTTWDHDVIKRILRTKTGESKILDYQKIKHICNERIRQLKLDSDGVKLP